MDSEKHFQNVLTSGSEHEKACRPGAARRVIYKRFEYSPKILSGFAMPLILKTMKRADYSFYGKRLSTEELKMHRTFVISITKVKVADSYQIHELTQQTNHSD